MFIRQNDTGKIGVGPFVDVTDGATMETAVTLSGADSARARLGDDTTVDISGYTWAAVASMDGYYDLTLQTGITDTVGPIDIIVEDVSVCLPVLMRFYVVEEAVYDAMYAASSAGFLDTASITGTIPGQGAPSATPTYGAVLMYLFTELVRDKVVVDTSGGTDYKFIYADNGTTILYKKVLTDAASVLTVAEAITGP